MGYIVDKDAMPDKWPTHRGSSDFWCELGRTVGTFGWLEMVLAQVYYALTASRDYNECGRTEESVRRDVEQWGAGLARSLTEALNRLKRRLEETMLDDDRVSADFAQAVVCRLERLIELRNALCHGHWPEFNEANGAGRLRYFARKNRQYVEIDEWFTREDIARIRCDAADVTMDLISLVTSLGVQFPGSNSPGRPL